MNDLAIRVENLSKLYRIGGKQERYKTLRDTLTDAFTAPLRFWRDRRRETGVPVSGPRSPVPGQDGYIWALKDVSFEACPERSRRVKRGEVVGIPSAWLRTSIGRNGAGKSTLLKSSPASPSRRRATPRSTAG